MEIGSRTKYGIFRSEQKFPNGCKILWFEQINNHDNALSLTGVEFNPAGQFVTDTHTRFIPGMPIRH